MRKMDYRETLLWKNSIDNADYRNDGLREKLKQNYSKIRENAQFVLENRIWRRKQEQSTVSSEWYLFIQTLLMSIWRISKRSRSDREISRRSKVFEIALD